MRLGVEELGDALTGSTVMNQPRWGAFRKRPTLDSRANSINRVIATLTHI